MSLGREGCKSGLAITVKMSLLQFHLYASLKTAQHFSRQLVSLYQKNQLLMSPISGRQSTEGLWRMEAVERTCVWCLMVEGCPLGSPMLFCSKAQGRRTGSQPDPTNRLELIQSFRSGWYFVTNTRCKQLRIPSRTTTSDWQLKQQSFSTA